MITSDDFYFTFCNRLFRYVANVTLEECSKRVGVVVTKMIMHLEVGKASIRQGLFLYERNWIMSTKDYLEQGKSMKYPIYECLIKDSDDGTHHIRVVGVREDKTLFLMLQRANKVHEVGIPSDESRIE